MTILVTASWVGATHCIKFLCLNRGELATSTKALSASASASASALPASISSMILPITASQFLTTTTTTTTPSIIDHFNTVNLNNNFNENTTIMINTFSPTSAPGSGPVHIFNAPFFASWFCTNFCILFFPIYYLGRVAFKKCDGTEVLGDVLRGFRDRGFTIGKYLKSMPGEAG